MTARDKEILNNCYQKCVKGSKHKKQEAKVAKVIKEKKELKRIDKVNQEPADAGIGTQLGVSKSIVVTSGSRNDLMLKCKEAGVKNFRVLNKQELLDCLANIDDKAKVGMIVEGAVARWRTGWGTKKDKGAGSQGASHE